MAPIDRWPIQDLLKAVPQNTTTASVTTNGKQYDFLLDNTNNVIGLILFPADYAFTFTNPKNTTVPDSYKYYILIFKQTYAQVSSVSSGQIKWVNRKPVAVMKDVTTMVTFFHVGIYPQKPTWTGNERPSSYQRFTDLQNVVMNNLDYEQTTLKLQPDLGSLFNSSFLLPLASLNITASHSR